MREVWIDAYLTGDVEQLAYVESAHFFVKHGGLTKTKQQQLARLRTFSAEYVSRMSGMTYVDESRCIIEYGEWATISGICAMRNNGQVFERNAFTELWVIDDGRWQVAALCYRHQPHLVGANVGGPSGEQGCTGGMRPIQIPSFPMRPTLDTGAPPDRESQSADPSSLSALAAETVGTHANGFFSTGPPSTRKPSCMSSV